MKSTFSILTPLVVKFNQSDEKKHILAATLTVHSPKYGYITVPAGFATDFASVPGVVLLPGIVPRIGKIRWGAVVHDYIYRGNTPGRFTRKEADEILLDLALSAGMTPTRAKAAYIGVRMGGWAAWEGNV